MFIRFRFEQVPHEYLPLIFSTHKMGISTVPSSQSCEACKFLRALWNCSIVIIIYHVFASFPVFELH